MAKKLGFTYTRYADDLSFSTSKDNEANISKLLYFLKRITETEGFTIHPRKTHIMRKGNLQKVTGIVVNEKQNVERNQLRKFRALLHNIEMNGWKDQKWGFTENLPATVEGYINFVRKVNPEKAAKCSEQLKRIVQKHGLPVAEQKPQQVKTEPVVEKQETKPVVEEKKTTDTNKNTDWWNIFS